MLDWAIELSEAAGSALMRAAATDAWNGARAGVVKLFHPAGEKKTELVAVRLDADALSLAEINEVDRDRARERLSTMWAVRINDLLDEHPELVDGVRKWLADLESDLELNKAWTQTNTACGGGTVFAVMNGSQTVNAAPILGARADGRTKSITSADDATD